MKNSFLFTTVPSVAAIQWLPIIGWPACRPDWAAMALSKAEIVRAFCSGVKRVTCLLKIQKKITNLTFKAKLTGGVPIVGITQIRHLFPSIEAVFIP